MRCRLASVVIVAVTAEASASSGKSADLEVKIGSDRREYTLAFEGTCERGDGDQRVSCSIGEELAGWAEVASQAQRACSRIVQGGVVVLLRRHDTDSVPDLETRWQNKFESFTRLKSHNWSVACHGVN